MISSLKTINTSAKLSQSMKSSIKRNYKTFHFQETLPRLPVPDLDKTVNLYLKTLLPLLPKNEYDVTKKLADDFVSDRNAGPKLQQLLLNRAENLKSTSWLHDWWNSYAYMSYREPLVNNVSFCYAFEDLDRNTTQVGRAANLVSYLLAIKRSIEDQSFPPDTIRDVPQCMHAYNNLFSTCRIPSPGEDVSYRAPSPKESSHIVVMRRNQFFSLDVHDANGNPLHRDAIEQLLTQIINDAKSMRKELPVGILTSDHRDAWTKVREILRENEMNRESLKVIENCSFILNLDDVSPKDEVELSKALLNGISSKYSSSNRFYDKTLNIVVFENGKSGLVGEHSVIDGYPVTVITDTILQQERDGVVLEGSRDTSKALPKYLEFDLNLASMKGIEYAKIKNNDLCKELSLNILRYSKYGKNEIKKFKTSPDGFLQMAFHLAYYRQHKKFAPTYESCSTRKYAYGRTETGRTLSVDVVNFVLAMEDSNVDNSERFKLLGDACTSHVAYIKEASEGYGCDRHLLGLKLLAQEHGIEHPFLQDPSHSKSSHWLLSTSQLPSKYSLTGYGPVVSDGYGLYYNIRNENLNFVITNFENESNTSSAKFCQSLEKSLDDIHLLCSVNIRSKL